MKKIDNRGKHMLGKKFPLKWRKNQGKAQIKRWSNPEDKERRKRKSQK